MNFDFSDDARTLQDQARRVFDETAGPDAARAVMNDPDKHYDEAIWKQAVELGLTAIRVPEEHGGVGLGAEEACLIAEEIGRGLVPAPLISTMLFTEALLIAGSAEQQAKWLPGVADGSVIGCFGWGEGASQLPSSMPDTRMAKGGLTGTKSPVADAPIANAAVVSYAGEDGPALALVDLSRDDARVTVVETLDLVRPHGTIELKGVEAEPLGTSADYQDFLDRAAVLLSFEALGTQDAAMRMAVDYAKERVAFGQRIGRYQGVKHNAADMYVKGELARAHAMHGAWAFQAGSPELRQAAAAARTASLDAVTYTAEENVQMHGGIGYTWESNCQFYYRRARAISAMLGSRGFWSDRLVRSLENRNAEAA
ncbi:acyl-CoA dehydrogenase [Pacificimonas flava]|uniref:Acyl-CoA dehydrogenase n=2 Tax=Pacificimonas TaxID=1960290 RepID=A0A219B4K9_9SPHN|nr:MULTISPECIES: acyl-CoA dehydrogenase family protein [Pacificimonas]MBZ6377195.1 acyl-CoA/acyl-ACP dehydrogenase [Pacificimonas aurantium]OWV33083.1 acyl-CoA dehydrogenase [Pacificimonas flava]